MKNNVIFDFERYGATGIYLFLIFILFATSFAVILREAKDQNSNWSAPIWFANVITLVLSCFVGSLILRIIEVGTELSTPVGPWNLIPIALIGWVSTFFLHMIVKKIAPEKLKFMTMKMFS